MRVLLAHLFLIISLSLINSVKADDIRDFQIEGMSIRDSLLDYVTEEIIIKNSYHIYKNKDFVSFVNFARPESLYDGYQVSYKNKDKKYIIYSLEGIKLFKDNINDCEVLRKQIVNELKYLFSNPSIEENIGEISDGDPSGKSKVNISRFYLNKDLNREDIQISCYDWAEGFKFEDGSLAVDKLTVSIVTQEFLDFLKNEYN